MRAAFGTLVVIGLLGVLGALLGWVGRWAYIIGLPVILSGLAAGGLVSVLALTQDGAISRRWSAVAVVGVLAAWAGHQWMDDRQFSASFTADYAAARFADSGASADAAFDEDDLAFFGEGASEVLEEQVRRKVGYGGLWGRWMFRSDAGIRLVGPWTMGRGLRVGRPWVIAWALLELVLAFWLATSVLARTRRARLEAAEPPMSASDGPATRNVGSLR